MTRIDCGAECSSSPEATVWLSRRQKTAQIFAIGIAQQSACGKAGTPNQTIVLSGSGDSLWDRNRDDTSGGDVPETQLNVATDVTGHCVIPIGVCFSALAIQRPWNWSHRRRRHWPSTDWR
ncbi:MAG: hypothetical protein KDA85_17975, partial [Planctomycetaceae bacterium]|nr:hypothetical protein [Planctomycetaceae bacterium]